MSAFLTAVPALRGLRRGLPDHRVVLAAPSMLHPLAMLTDALDALLPAADLGPATQKALRGLPRVAVAVNLHCAGPDSQRLLDEVGAGSTIAFSCSNGGPGNGTHVAWRDDEHEVRRWCRLVDAHLGPVCDVEDLVLRSPARQPAVRDAVIVHPGASPARRWPVEHYAAVAKRLHREGHRVVVTGSIEERGLASWLARQAGLPASAVLAGALDLGQLAAIVAHARLVLCADTGMAHLASGYQTPSVVLFGPTDPARCGPPARPQHRVLWIRPPQVDPAAAAAAIADALPDASCPATSKPGTSSPGTSLSVGSAGTASSGVPRSGAPLPAAATSQTALTDSALPDAALLALSPSTVLAAARAALDTARPVPPQLRRSVDPQGLLAPNMNHLQPTGHVG